MHPTPPPLGAQMSPSSNVQSGFIASCLLPTLIPPCLPHFRKWCHGPPTADPARSITSPSVCQQVLSMPCQDSIPNLFPLPLPKTLVSHHCSLYFSHLPSHPCHILQPEWRLLKWAHFTFLLKTFWWFPSALRVKRTLLRPWMSPTPPTSPPHLRPLLVH